MSYRTYRTAPQCNPQTSDRPLCSPCITSVNEREHDIEAAINIDSSAVAREQSQAMLGGSGTDERVIDRSAGNADGAEAGQQLGGSLRTEKARCREVMTEQ